MNQIISVKKDIIFKTKISEITSLTLEHDYKIKEDLVEGKLVLSGAYKMTEASLIEEEFLYNIPFSISISENINKETINIEIEDFKYETNKDVMKINVDLNLECEENEIEDYEETQLDEMLGNIEPLDEIEQTDELDDIEKYFEEMEEEEIKPMEKNILNSDTYMDDIGDIDDDFNESQEVMQSSNETTEAITNITNIINKNEEKYHSYKVYIIKQGDTIQTICDKYKIHLDDLKEYNDITNINVGDKIIIPQIINE